MDCLFWPFWVLGREERGGIPGGLGAQRKKGGAPGRTPATLPLAESWFAVEKAHGSPAVLALDTFLSHFV